MRILSHVRKLTTALAVVSLYPLSPASAQIFPIVPEENHQTIPEQPRQNTPSKNQQTKPNQNRNTSQPKVVPKPKVNRQPVSKPEPPPVLVPESAKSQDQKDYEIAAQKKLDGFIARIQALEDGIEKMPQDTRKPARAKLRTAQGNRSVARTKLKQLKYVRPNDWFTLQNGIEKAFTNLEGSVQAAESAIPGQKEVPETPPTSD